MTFDAVLNRTSGTKPVFLLKMRHGFIVDHIPMRNFGQANEEISRIMCLYRQEISCVIGQIEGGGNFFYATR